MEAKKAVDRSNVIVENILPNRGTGAGGAGTNKTGLSYEKKTELNSEYNVLHTYKHYTKIKFNLDHTKIFIIVKKAQLFQYLKQSVNKKIEKAHGCKSPDECFIDETTHTIFIIEKKFQRVSGSACEKIQTPDFKIWQYSRTFPDYNIVYVYCLSSWFRENCKAELEYLEYKNIQVFWGDSPTYKHDIVNFMLNYK